jgi:DNA-binding MarR family transcriptional regulator
VGAQQSDETVDAVLEASRALVAMVVRSINAVEPDVDLVGVRVLVFVGARETASLREVADALAMHVSTASRLCDRLVSRRLLQRRDDPADRRQLALRLSAGGQRVVERMLSARRREVAAVLGRLPATRRQEVAEALRAFADAAGEVPEHDMWTR